MTPKARPFCDRQVGELRECANRGRNTWFPAPRSPSALTRGPHPSAAPTGCRSLGTQERTKWACPAAMATPESTTGKPSPTPARSRPQPRPDPAPRRPGSPRPCRAPVAFPAAVGTPENTTETAPHPLPTGTPTHAARVRPTPGAARCSPSPGAPGEPRPHARFQERLWLLPPVQTRGQYIHPTGTIQAVYDLGIKRGLQKGKVT